MSHIHEGMLLWEPSALLRERCELTTFMAWLAHHGGPSFSDYHELWHWSVENLEPFWAAISQYFNVRFHTAAETVLANAHMPGARWFPGATLNYAEQAFMRRSDIRPAIIFQSETQALSEISWAQLEYDVAATAAGLRALGLQTGDRVAAYLPNCPQAVVALLACAALGAIWSSCSPDMGAGSVIDRFQQIEPRVLLAIDGYHYGGKAFDRMPLVREIQQALPSLTRTVLLPYLNATVDPNELPNTMAWSELLARHEALHYEPLPFDHPLWILYSSGTTGLPKPIVQGHGGIVLEHLKSVALHMDIGPTDRFFWFTTTGWMMWNFLVGGLLVGSTILLYDGSPAWPTMSVLWDFAERSGMTCFGTSAAYINACMKAGMQPGTQHDLHALKSMGSTGSPLSSEGFAWVYREVGAHIWLASISGGTDVCTAFVGGCPLLPVYAGEIQCRELGVGVQAFDEQGQALFDQVGELVVTTAMPSMPLFFWNDTQGQRYHESYFEHYPGIWRHGDWIKITPRQGVIIYGRSDATINRMGIRVGTAELYRAVEGIPEVLDSLVVDLEGLGGAAFMPMFVVLAPNTALDDALEQRIKLAIRQRLTARHVPDEIYAVADIPRTLNGKKLEMPIRKILMGAPAEQVLNPDTMANPQVIELYRELAVRIREKKL